jgi:hypothetical protein
MALRNPLKPFSSAISTPLRIHCGERSLPMAEPAAIILHGVNRSLVGRFALHEDGNAPDADVSGPYYTLEYHFVLAEDTPTYPTPPIK